jgi:hypothetical protein
MHIPTWSRRCVGWRGRCGGPAASSSSPSCTVLPHVALGRVLSAHGWTRLVGGYFREGHWRSDRRTGPPGRVGAYHRTLAAYPNTLLEAGFALKRPMEAAAIEGGRQPTDLEPRRLNDTL